MIYSFLCKDQKLSIGERPLIMGILNVTPDSFSDGGVFFDTRAAVRHAEYLVESGADIIDVGGESTRPFSHKILVEEEISRVIPVIELLSQKISIPISIDTTKAKVAEKALISGASIVNDVSSMLFDQDMIKVISDYGAGVVLMHMRGTPNNMQLNLVYDDLLLEIFSFLSSSVDRAITAGINRSSIILDPGLGFGKSTNDNLKILKKLNRFKKLKLPILVGPSRKSFIRNILKNNLKENDNLDPISLHMEFGTQAAIVASVFFGADIVRAHNVLNTCITLNLINSIRKS